MLWYGGANTLSWFLLSSLIAGSHHFLSLFHAAEDLKLIVSFRRLPPLLPRLPRLLPLLLYLLASLLYRSLVMRCRLLLHRDSPMFSMAVGPRAVVLLITGLPRRCRTLQMPLQCHLRRTPALRQKLRPFKHPELALRPLPPTQSKRVRPSFNVSARRLAQHLAPYLEVDQPVSHWRTQPSTWANSTTRRPREPARGPQALPCLAPPRRFPTASQP
jgi:hypothetical protein